MRTVAQFEYERDVERPLRIRLQELRTAAYHAYAAKGPEQARQSRSALRGLENNLKRERGFLEILSDPAFLKARRAAESALRARVAADPKLRAAYGERVGPHRRCRNRAARAGARAHASRPERASRGSWTSPTASCAMTAELEKPNEKRFREYQDSNLPLAALHAASPRRRSILRWRSTCWPRSFRFASTRSAPTIRS